jgi:alcohol dehydrogenase
MRAAVYHGPEDIRVEERPTPEVESPTDALVRVTHTAICGSDLWFYRGESGRETGSPVGHEPMGIVEDVGEAVRSVEPGDRVFAPFVVSCGFCEFCRKGLHTSCVNGDSWGGENGGAQGEYVRTPHADGTLVRVPDRHAGDERTLKALLPLTDVLGTGHHAAVSAGVEAGSTCVVVGDGAVGLCGVLAARRLGAERTVAVGHHEDRLELATRFGATETVVERGEAAVDRVVELTDGGAITSWSASEQPRRWKPPSGPVVPAGRSATSASPTAWTNRGYPCTTCSGRTSHCAAASRRSGRTPRSC